MRLAENSTVQVQKCLPLEVGEGVWRPIHYLGSKLRIATVIGDAIDKLDPSHGRVCDLFSGSGTVSLALSHKREVTAVDIQEYSRTLCSAVLNPAQLGQMEISNFTEQARSSEFYRHLHWIAEPLINLEQDSLRQAQLGRPDAICELLENSSLILFGKVNNTSVSKPITEALREAKSRLDEAKLSNKSLSVLLCFGGLYFSYKQAVELSSLLHNLPSHNHSARDTFLAAVLSTASDLVNTVGKQFAQPIRPYTKDREPKKHLIRQILRDRSLSTFQIFGEWLLKYGTLTRNNFTHKAIRSDYLEFLKSSSESFSVVYADPPYTRDHYSRFYHVLETICLQDLPDISTNKLNNQVAPSRALYRKDRHQSPFSIKSQAPTAFAALFTQVRNLEIPLVLSYSPLANAEGRPRVMSIEDIEDLAKKSFSKVEISSAGEISHNKLNHARLNSEVSYNAELLFLCQP